MKALQRDTLQLNGKASHRTAKAEHRATEQSRELPRQSNGMAIRSKVLRGNGEATQ